MTSQSLSPDQIAALTAYAAQHGRTWKSKLSAEWERSGAGEVMQELRNASCFGPAGPKRFRLEAPMPIAAPIVDLRDLPLADAKAELSLQAQADMPEGVLEVVILCPSGTNVAQATDTLKAAAEQMLRDRILELDANNGLSEYERARGADWHWALLSLVDSDPEVGYTTADLARRRLVAEWALEARLANAAAGNTISYTANPEIFEAFRLANLAVLDEAERPASSEPETFGEALGALLDSAGIPESSPQPEHTDEERATAAADYAAQMAGVVTDSWDPLNGYFARPVEGGYAILHKADGEPVTRLRVTPPVWPIGSDLSGAYEHPRGIVLTAADVSRLAIEIEG